MGVISNLLSIYIYISIIQNLRVYLNYLLHFGGSKLLVYSVKIICSFDYVALKVYKIEQNLIKYSLYKIEQSLIKQNLFPVHKICMRIKLFLFV